MHPPAAAENAGYSRGALYSNFASKDDLFLCLLERHIDDDAIGIRSQCYLALTFDHRLIDGALGDQFTAKVKSILENWAEEVL